MSANKRYDKSFTKTEKMKIMSSAKNEDVEFSAELADKEDVEALRRSEAANHRQERILTDPAKNKETKL
ncbi:YfhD family protein [Paenibacillus sp. P96]|uniref:YfhD family protein n=1 Tax=Paenibacillus zeirhizosphaerae TaxID=2987519 RepID=A0ABT9FQJ7_9BACL|nr:YfhD family protein [Paenibacillus sp. P96]MDP4097005.1 YfhD family protein [Paenibacillus sp. P96]